MTSSEVETFQSSVSRCLARPDFMKDFYEFSPAIDAAWRETPRPGIEYMQARYSDR